MQPSGVVHCLQPGQTQGNPWHTTATTDLMVQAGGPNTGRGEPRWKLCSQTVPGKPYSHMGAQCTQSSGSESTSGYPNEGARRSSKHVRDSADRPRCAIAQTQPSRYSADTVFHAGSNKGLLIQPLPHYRADASWNQQALEFSWPQPTWPVSARQRFTSSRFASPV